MSGFARVPVHQSVGKFIPVEPGATRGAVVGRDLFNADGTLFDLDSLLNAGAAQASSGASSGTAQGGVISPAQLTGNTDDWAPTDLSTAGTIRASTDASRNLTGLTGGAANRAMQLFNVGAFDLVLIHDATSTAANRFLCPGSANLTLQPNDGVRLWYDGTSSRWRVIGV